MTSPINPFFKSWGQSRHLSERNPLLFTSFFNVFER
ncbi:unnamed protein product [Brassica napus]|uniref:(rape) hypothetical protein n=1 Tax=Brassica napus TaxID=3708 RepID=A0A816NPS0_BRANA|nr:unnamed protein product [Brassica napus]